MLHFTPPGYVQCDLCGCTQPLSAVVTYLDGHVCSVHKPHLSAELDAQAERDAILNQQSKGE